MMYLLLSTGAATFILNYIAIQIRQTRIGLSDYATVDDDVLAPGITLSGFFSLNYLD